MEHQVEPDVEIDLCPNCQGRFLDKGELNSLVTGLSGDIEHRSRAWTDMLYAVEGHVWQDAFPLRACPVCEDQPMQKIGVTCGVDVVLDGCPECGGFFVDHGELESLDAGLALLSADKNPEELRERRDGLLVRVNKVWGGYGGASPFGTNASPALHYQVIVYYSEPLGLELHLFRERWLSRITSVLGLYGGQDIETGDAEFDSAFVIRGDDFFRVQALLSNEVRQVLLQFCRDRLALQSQTGSLQVHDHCVTYGVGPIPGTHRSTAIDWRRGGPSDLVDRLVSVARTISGNPGKA